MSTSSTSGNPRVVIIGRGWGVNIQVPAFKHAGWDVEAVITRSEADEQPSNQAYKVVHESQLENVLKSPLVKLVTITSPPITHARYFQTINDFNKQSNSKVHVLCEKPFAMNLAEAKSMVVRLRETQLSNDQSTSQSVHQSINQFAPYGWIDHELRCLKAVKLTRDFVAAEAFGPVHSVNILHFGSLSVKPAYSWWNDASQRGGVLGAVGSHMIDLLHFLTGSSIDVVSAQLNTAVPDKIDTATNQKKTATSDDYASFVGTAISNQSSNQSINQVHKFPLSITVTSNSGGFLSRKSCLIAGRNQSVELDLETLTVTAWIEGKKQVLIDGQDYVDSEVELIKLSKNPFAAGTVLLARRLKEIVLSDHPIVDSDLATLEDGLKVQAVMDAIYQSADGKSVKVSY